MLAWPLKHPDLPNHISQHIISSSVIKQVAKIAIRALSFGLLIRGAITVGEFYHENGIFFGKAFDEACYLESEIAICPRIIISNKIFGKNLIMTTQEQNSPNCRKIWLTDFDHINYLSYFYCISFRQAFWFGVNPRNEELLNKVIKDWIIDCSMIIDKKINSFSSKSTIMKPLQKWWWFSDYFKNSIISLSENDNWTGANSQFLTINRGLRF